MARRAWAWRLGHEALLLNEAEWAEIAGLIQDRYAAWRDWRRRTGLSLSEAEAHFDANGDPPARAALDAYERMTGIRLSRFDGLRHVRLRTYGAPCPVCGKPFRTPQARFCAACGHRLPAGERAGPLSDGSAQLGQG